MSGKAIDVGGIKARVSLIRDGEVRRYSGRNGVRAAKLGHVYEVRVGDAVIGYVHRRITSREQRTGHRTYVNSRWDSPGWFYGDSAEWARRETHSLTSAIEMLVRDYVDGNP